MNTQRAVIYKERAKVLKGENVHEDILKLIPDYVTATLAEGADLGEMPSNWEVDRLNKVIEDKLLPRGTEFITEEMCTNYSAETITKKVLQATIDAYEEKIEQYKQDGFDYHEFERQVMLKTVDNKWIDHIDDMDQLRRGIGFRAYGNEDPVIAYKREGFAMFDALIESIQTDTIRLLLKAELKKAVEKPKDDPALSGGGIHRAAAKVGRNDPCPCGSGKKYKDCCGRK